MGTDPAPFWDQVKVSCRTQVTDPAPFWAGQGELQDHLRTIRTDLQFLGPGQGELWVHLRALETDPAPFWEQVKVSCGTI